MAKEIKNTFLKSKMNKDLDDRILPNGEYRDAQNISVGRSEDNDVGALENIIGNNLMTSTDLPSNLRIIGIKDSSVDNKLFIFLTNYTDPNPTSPTFAPDSTEHYIYSFNTITEEYTKLLSGEFLNFSTTNRIIGINLIESLLFWTDNRNQPRKININLAVGSNGSSSRSSTDQQYYTQEHQISVAKYNPYEAIKLYNRLSVEINGFSPAFVWVTVSGDRVQELTPYIGATVVSSDIANLSGADYVKIASITISGSNTRITFNKALTSSPTIGDTITFIKSTMSNKDSEVTWPGDPNYLENIFVRFSYRFKYDDNEYSLMAPFTQIAYIPKQKGYLINGDEEAAYRSTILKFMENNVQNIGLIIPLPDSGSRINSTYKISEVDILFTESNSSAVKVLASITTGAIGAESGLNNYYNYDYQSRKHYRTLPEAQTVRVYDKVPITAFAQESAGNRIIYGNFKDKHTPPLNINYNCRIAKKNNTGLFNNFVEYPNHSVKRNRTYQIGFVLSDKFGRQSPVILSSVDNGEFLDGEFYSGSTIYNPYDSVANETNVQDWFGDCIQLILNSPIQSTFNNSSGTPGLYAIPQKNVSLGDGFAIGIGGSTGINGNVWNFRYTGASFPLNQNIPEPGNYLRGEYVDFVKVISITGPLANLYEVTTTGQVNSLYLPTPPADPAVPDLRFAYTINNLGWYSYKIVVKQTEQEYYNVYLPGILNGYPGQSFEAFSNIIGGSENSGAFPSDELNLTAHTVLFNDNINKIPRDLEEVGPQEKQFRSSVELYGRVTNIMNPTALSTADPSPSNLQYYPLINNSKNAIAHLASTIATASDLDMSFKQLSNSRETVTTEQFTGDGVQKEFTFTSINALQLENNLITLTINGVSTTRFNIIGSTLYFATAPLSTETVVVTATGVVGQAGGIDGNKVFYQIDSNPLIARISTAEKGIGWGAELTTNPNGSNPTWNWNMQPYLAIYETEPVESLLDIYWETTSEGLVADLNADVLTGYEGITSFQNFSWDFPESKAPGEALTGWFEPYTAQGVFNPNTTPTLTSVTNGDNDTINIFDLVLGDTFPNVGKFQIRLKDTIDNGITFINGSNLRDVFEFEITINTPGGQEDVLYVGGIPSGDGALKNVAPSFDTISNIQVQGEDSLVLAASVWTTKNVQNGTSITNEKTNGLIYSITGAPADFVINSDNGQITKTPNVTSNGSYTFSIRVTDASDGSGVGLYGPLFAEQTITVTIADNPVNPEVLDNVCYVNISAVQADNPSFKAVNTPEPQPGFLPTTGGRWYIAASPLTSSDLPLVSGNFDNGPIYRMGSGVHTSGTVIFSFNIEAEAGTPVFGFNFPAVYSYIRLYYRYTGDPDWLLMDDDNLIKENNNIRTSPLSGTITNEEVDWPASVNDGTWSTSTSTDKGWVHFLRAFNKSAFETEGDTRGIEYCFTMSGFGSGSPGVNRSRAWLTVDDLNNPVCAPWQGKNAATTSQLGSAFKYNASVPGTARELPLNWPSSGLPAILYAKTPYADYVQQFFTDSTLTTLYIPSTLKPFVNYSLDNTFFTTSLPYWKYSLLTDTKRNLFVAAFDSVNGSKIPNQSFVTNSTLTGNALSPYIFSFNFPTGDDNILNGYLNRGVSRLYNPE
jgi:hypothetical protein